MTPLTAHRGALLHFLNDPGANDDAQAYAYFEDGLLLVENGRVRAADHAERLLPTLPPGTELIDHGRALLMPGFVDCHIHSPQTDVIASGGQNLLDWLEHYTFPAERRFGDAAHGREVSEFFLDELMRNGTTTAQVFGTVHPESVDSFFEAAAARGLRMIAGKSLMDRNCPEDLRDTPELGDRQCRELIERWDGQGRLNYAITVRFAVTSSEAQLQRTAQLAADFPDMHVHSHLAENADEIAWVQRLFPQHGDYLGVYEHYGLIRPRATYAHCIHLSPAQRTRMARAGAAAAFSPTSNLYLGSGLFDLDGSNAAGLRYGVATDVGGGSSFSMLRTLAACYEVAQMRGQSLSPIRAFYLATRGGACILGLDDRIGSFEPGREADFIVLDPAATPLLARRSSQTRTLREQLQVLMILGDDRAVRQTYILGQPATLNVNTKP